MVSAICKEIELRSNYINDTIETIYFGGGTPSLLDEDELLRIINQLNKTFDLSTVKEFTIETNPEDYNEDILQTWKSLGINRLSIGFQTFSESKLKWMNRIHDKTQSIHSFTMARKNGFDNITIDLIYALPGRKNQEFNEDLSEVIRLNPEHISFYGLTIEEKTVFGNWTRKNKLVPMDDEKAASEYILGSNRLKLAGYQHYEVSNFAKAGFESIHNSNYWAGVPYIGIGPGAHSFDGHNRSINISNNPKYIRSINDNGEFYQLEKLNKIDRVNEIILTQLRTIKGIDLVDLIENWGYDLMNFNQQFISSLIKNGMAKIDENRLFLTTKGFLVADDIVLELIIEE